jgi:vacuolar protein sorting-associated protein 26
MGVCSVLLPQSFDFEFAGSADKPFESYNGVNVRCRYFVKVSAARNYAANLVAEKDLWVVNTETVSLPVCCGRFSCLHPLGVSLFGE